MSVILSENEQQNLIGSFWTMLQECEAKAESKDDAVLKHWVEQWYEQYNRITKSHSKPRWL